MSTNNFRPSDPHRASLPADLTSLSQRFSPLFQTRKPRASSIYSRPIFPTPNVPSRHISTSTTSTAVSGSTTLASNSYTVSSLDVNLVAFELLFAEIVRYTQQRVDGIGEFEKKLNILGYQVGSRLLSLLSLRDALSGSPNALSLSTGKSISLGGGSISSASSAVPIRLIRLVPVLSWIHSTLWKTVVGKAADVLEHSNENEDEYMISDNDLLITRAITIPKDMSQLSCGAYMAGIVEGALDGLGFVSHIFFNTFASFSFSIFLLYLRISIFHPTSVFFFVLV
ncbi:TRAPP subunit trs31, variant 2 [Puccinia graminis f. sp. tritici]|uniref:TRAPP subunit trs31, variant 2 n=1 Tax=Puccinia graminis f. sp. tritici TaxID=56615 RepID=A0A5B0MH92_PUCGR|nr:TRAPP subunit trs31, variant 2 [Puccinia graminis f. sp. tritici]KAA1135648.1 TRAPP subunit trs31, variant 2 [Puccinia graminis f. sp. tritici]